ncbi:hypothetical protein MKZ38_008764 [Zalerion maritima]|uniref:Uncharacterized protein n=1 Tax=Zalerion maritima TaxID=339359 RepID=A0AAD5RU26_9PEZI|nr:hypothetical protein MKZ38_008764 [Zalerion maritima]
MDPIPKEQWCTCVDKDGNKVTVTQQVPAEGVRKAADWVLWTRGKKAGYSSTGVVEVDRNKGEGEGGGGKSRGEEGKKGIIPGIPDFSQDAPVLARKAAEVYPPLEEKLVEKEHGRPRKPEEPFEGVDVGEEKKTGDEGRKGDGDEDNTHLSCSRKASIIYLQSEERSKRSGMRRPRLLRRQNTSWGQRAGIPASPPPLPKVMC